MQDLFLQLLVGALVALPFYLVFRLLNWRGKKRRPDPLRECLLCFFVLFMAGLVALVVRPAGQGGEHALTAWDRLRTGQGINLVPFATIRGFFALGWGTPFVVNICANVLMFCPLGFFLPLFWRRMQKGWKVLCAGVLFSVCIETIQIFVGRSVDVDDVILNVAGVMLGYLAYFLLRRSRVPLHRLEG